MMKTVKVSNLSGAALDWAVAKCEPNPEHVTHKNGVIRRQPVQYAYAPSTDWAQGGPIIARERMGVWPSDSIEGMWAARPDYEVYPERLPPAYGPTPLIAAMRCYVASKMGDTIDIPEELA